MQNDLVPEFPPLVGFENIVTATDAFSRFLFAYPKSNQDAKTIARVINFVMTKHAYLPTTFISDKGSAFMYQVIKKLLASLGLLQSTPQQRTRKWVGCLDDLTRQSNKRWRVTQVTEDNYVKNTSALRSLNITFLITQVFAVSWAERFVDAFLKMS